jgi:GR25 family glycosyltransferase involved in LPS biosynthesis
MDAVLASPCFIVHLPKHTERIPVYQRIQEAGFQKIYWYPAVRGDQLPSIRQAMARLQLGKLDHGISTGALGCLLSHLCLLQQIIQEEIPVATIFEDDVLFHPEWSTLAPQYFEKMVEEYPGYEVVFLGNQLDRCRVFREPGPMLTQEPVYCTHAYVVTLEGARRMLICLLEWNYRDNSYTGLTLIDVMIKKLQFNSNYGLNKQIFQWYSWNGTKYPSIYNKLPITNLTCRNTGLVFQDTRFPSMVQRTEVVHLGEDYTLRPSTRRVVRPMSFR